MAELNYDRVNKYWHTARPSILGPYMMDGFGFPAAAGRFRFREEIGITQRMIAGLNPDGTVLDLGSGIGHWAEHFAAHFAKVVAVEASTPLYDALKQRCVSYSNVETIQGDVLSFEPEDRYELVFLGGLLMYLNEGDAVSLLRKLVGCLEPGGIIVCRETTVRQGVVTRDGEYQAVYRSVETYARMFNECGLSVVTTQQNTPYVLLQMGCEFVKKWKALVPKPLQWIPVVGHFVYGTLRIGYPWIVHIPGVFRLQYPMLTNHFFVLQPDAPVGSDIQESNGQSSRSRRAMRRSLGKLAYDNLANAVSILGVLPLCLLFLKDGFQYLIPLIVYNNFMDDLDGVLAAKLNIRSGFGAILDNVCDAFSHTLFVMLVVMQYADISAGANVMTVTLVLTGLAAITALLLRVVSRLSPERATGTGSPTNELVRHLLFVLLLEKTYDFNLAPFLIVVFALHAVSMLAPFRMPYLIRSLTKSASAISLVNVAIVVAWLVPNTTLVIAACFVISYLYSFGWGCKPGRQNALPSS